MNTVLLMICCCFNVANGVVSDVVLDVIDVLLDVFAI